MIATTGPLAQSSYAYGINGFWGEEDASAIEDMFGIKGRALGLGASSLQQSKDFKEHELIGPDGFRAFHNTLLELIGSVVIDVTDSMTRDDWIASLCLLAGKRRKTGKTVQMSGQVYLRVENGQIAEAYNHWDFIGLFADLGLLPADTLMRCLGGERIA